MNDPVKPLYLDLQTLVDVISLSKTTLYNLVREGSFPKPRVLTGRRVAWLMREVEAWAEGRPIASLQPPPNSGVPLPKGNISRVQQRSCPNDLALESRLTNPKINELHDLSQSGKGVGPATSSPLNEGDYIFEREADIEIADLTTIERDKLYEYVWRLPMVHIGAKYGVSGTAIKWACLQLNVPLPAKGHWSALKGGTPRKRTPLAAASSDQPTIINVASLVEYDVPRPRGRPKKKRTYRKQW
jgi:prophage regulatory protein